MVALNQAFARLAAATYRQAWRSGPDDPMVGRMAEVLRRATEEIERAREPQTAGGAK
jgi:hypothetical protein